MLYISCHATILRRNYNFSLSQSAIVSLVYDKMHVLSVLQTVDRFSGDTAAVVYVGTSSADDIMVSLAGTKQGSRGPLPFAPFTADEVNLLGPGVLL